MSKPRKAKKPGPLPHQQRMRSARELRRLQAVEQRSTDMFAALQEMDAGLAHSRACAEGIRAGMAALEAVLSPVSEFASPSPASGG